MEDCEMGNFDKMCVCVRLDCFCKCTKLYTEIPEKFVSHEFGIRFAQSFCKRLFLGMLRR